VGSAVCSDGALSSFDCLLNGCCAFFSNATQSIRGGLSVEVYRASSAIMWIYWALMAKHGLTLCSRTTRSWSITSIPPKDAECTGTQQKSAGTAGRQGSHFFCGALEQYRRQKRSGVLYRNTTLQPRYFRSVLRLLDFLQKYLCTPSKIN
jgi:hypothetical protein